MFLGGTPNEILSHVLKMLDSQKVNRFFCPFAGNFFLEQMVRNAKNPKIEIHSTDVSTYSNLIGFGFADIKHEIRLLQDYERYFDFIENKTSDDYAAISMIMSDLAITIFRSNKIEYYRRLLRQYCLNREKYFKKTLTKYKQVKEVIRSGPFSYYGIDAAKVLDMATRDSDMVYYDPPFNTGSYEVQFKIFNDCFTGNNVEYSDITPEVVERNLQVLHDRGCKVIYRGIDFLIKDGIINIPPQYELVHRLNYAPESSYLLYTNILSTKKKIFNTFHINEKEVNFRLIDEAAYIGFKSKVKIVKVKNEVLNHYRLMWIKKAQMVGGTGVSYLFFVDDKMIGGVQIVSGMAYGGTLAMILSDPICPFSRYKRLSKLLIALVCTRQFMEEINKETVWEHTGFYTRVFSNNQSSMKYRGLFDKTLVDELDKNSKTKYGITYRSKKIFPSIKAALHWWMQHHSTALFTNKLEQDGDE